VVSQVLQDLPAMAIPLGQLSGSSMSQRCINVVVPVRNQPDTLAELLASLTRQVLPEGWVAEIICVDNASTDHTPEIIASFPTVKALREERLGPSIARNTGVAAGSGELILFIDSDANVIGDDFLARVIALAEGLGDFAFFGGPIVLPPQQMSNPIAFADHMACWSAWSARRPEGPSDFQPTACVMQRKWFEKVGGYRTDIRVLEDWDVQTRVVECRLAEGGEKLPAYFVRSIPVTHSARSSLLRTIKHSWYWGLPSRKAWLRPGPNQYRYLETPVLRWLYLPGLFRARLNGPLRCGWRVSRVRSILSLPFLALTILVWTVAVIVGKGQPEANRYAPV
jgi:GT2 family glycosyltransferase